MIKNKEFYDLYFTNKFMDSIEKLKQENRIKKLSSLIPIEIKNCIFIGCGQGDEISILNNRKKIPNIYGIDISKTAIQHAKQKYPNINFVVGDACNLPFEDNSFDLIICSEVIEHLSSPDKLIDEINRVMENKGVLILSTSNWLSFYGLFRFLAEKLLRKKITAGDQPIDHWYTIKTINRILEKYFEINKIVGSWYYPPFGKGNKKIPNKFAYFFIKIFARIDEKMSVIFPQFGHIFVIRLVKKIC
jgi:ubiquinone/menaquinone biosynthesis C-methylase UbiE